MGLTERYVGTYVSAESAAGYIDAKGIIDGANKIKRELEELPELARDVKNAGSGLTPDTMFIEGLDCTAMVDAVFNIVSNSYTAMLGNLDEVIAAAEKVYNEKQEQYNQDARRRNQAEADRRAAESSKEN